ncbi:MAG: peptide deformylase [Bdellovibrionales bacterium]|nr:peptide deformylase [Bdellovibrionales bacterium]
MSVLEVLKYPHPVLKQVAKKIDSIDQDLKVLANNMLETMYKAPGVGLAAPQVGHSIRMVVIDTRPKDDDGNFTDEDMTELEKAVTYPLVLVNPVITKKEGTIKWEEGCLSVPGYVEEVERAAYVEVNHSTIDGEEVTLKADSLLAVCVQHEIDHLDGKVFIERLSQLKFDRIRKLIKKNGYDQPEA